ncbi:MAG: hypothetical protein KJ600_02965 [Nanoarchaeota archaeon]|nr:hypothetical protein [Nanoarchaeota archaeon]MBU1103490.1 hypothetical protein [Nanoarchaeota archaeon]
MSLTNTFSAIGIAIIFALLAGYGLQVFYESPSWRDKEVREQYNFQIFVILMVISALAVMAGTLLALFTNLNSLNSGLLGGGIITAVHGFARSLMLSNKYLGLAMLFTILILLSAAAVFTDLIKRRK